MKHFYARDYNTGKLVELSEEEFSALFGDKRTRGYANRVQRGDITLEEVPEDMRAAVEQSLIARRERFGEPQPKTDFAKDMETALNELGVVTRE